MISPQKLEKEKLMTNTDKDEVEGSFNFKISRRITMYTFFYLNISEFEGDLEGVIDEGTYQNIHTKYAQTWL